MTKMITKMNHMNAKKAGIIMNTPSKILKEAIDIVAQPLAEIRKFEVMLYVVNSYHN